MRRVVMFLSVFAMTARDKAPAQESASITVKLPPSHPYTPRPGFSVGSAAGQGPSTVPVEVEG